MMHEDMKNKNSESLRNIESVRLESDPAKKGAKGGGRSADLIRQAGPNYGRIKDPGEGGDDCNSDLICEAAPKYGHAQELRTETGTGWDRQGEYTLEDYYALPDEKRVELIDGVFYEMASPGSIHQILVSRIFLSLANYIDSNKGTCVPLISPMDVQLDKDDKTMLQPDVLIVCDREKFRKGIVYGAPDLVVEVLSKSTHSKDMIIKLNKYYNAGVREYWIIDPGNRQIIVYKFEEGLEFVVYDADSVVPVGIFDDECTVDFGKLFEYVSFLDGE